MTEGAKTGTPRMSDEWIADGNASHQDIMDLRDALTEALKVAGEGLDAAKQQLSGHFIRSCGTCDKCGGMTPSGTLKMCRKCAIEIIDSSIAALERIRNNKH